MVWRGRPARASGPGRAEGLGRVEEPGQGRARLRGDAGPDVFEKDPGSVACPGFIPRTSCPSSSSLEFDAYDISLDLRSLHDPEPEPQHPPCLACYIAMAAFFHIPPKPHRIPPVRSELRSPSPPMSSSCAIDSGENQGSSSHFFFHLIYAPWRTILTPSTFPS